jgi:hypothetical protein
MVRKELREFLRASDRLFESLASNASLTDFELRLLHSYVVRHHSFMLRALNHKRHEEQGGLPLFQSKDVTKTEEGVAPTRIPTKGGERH